MTKVSAPVDSMEYVKDEFGQEMLIQEGTFQVIMEWEKPYMEAAIDALAPKGDVLEVGFGLGYAATQIEKAHPKNHTIIDCEAVVLARAKKWAKHSKKIHLVEGTWQQAMPKMGIFDTIFYDAFAPLDEQTLGKYKQDVTDSTRIAEESQKLRETLSEALSQFQDVKFSDEDLLTFGSQILTRNDVQPADIANFINTLEEQGNISKIQKTMFLRQFAKQLKTKSRAGKQNPLTDLDAVPSNHAVLNTAMPFFVFADLCLSQNMRKGSRLGTYLRSPNEKLELKPFRERMRARKDVIYTEEEVTPDVPSHCQYYQQPKAFIIVIEKKS